MSLELALAIILIWFGIGAGIAAWIYADTKAHKKEVSWEWVGIGFLLSIIGVVAYVVATSTEKKRAYEYPPTTKYENPQYEFQGEKHEGAQPAVSEHDWQCPKCGAKLKY